MKHFVKCMLCFLILLTLPGQVFASREAQIKVLLDKIEAEKTIQKNTKDSSKEIAEKKDQGKTELEKVSPEDTKDAGQETIEKKYQATPKALEKLPLHLSGSLKNETAFRVSEPKKFTKIKNQLILSGVSKLSDNIQMKITGRAYYDAVYALDTFSHLVRSDQGSDIELRDAYADLSFGPFDARLGKQQIVWGEAVALFFADVVNARNLREFVLPDFDMIRIPQWGVDMEYAKSNFHAEFVWLPDVEFDKLGVNGSEFFPPPPLPSTNTLFLRQDPPKINSSFPNGNVGGRLSYLINGLDLSAFYYHTWTKAPVFYRAISPEGIYIYTPRYKRLDIIGASFAKDISGVVLKGEFVFNKNDYLPIFDVTNHDGIVKRDDLNYLLGADYTFFKRLQTNFQFMQRVIFNYSNLLINEKSVANSFAFRVKTDFLDGKLEPEFLIVTSLMKVDMMLRPKISYKINGNWQLKFGSDVFIGDVTGVFGRYDRKNRIYSEITYNF